MRNFSYLKMRGSIFKISQIFHQERFECNNHFQQCNRIQNQGIRNSSFCIDSNNLVERETRKTPFTIDSN